MKPQIFTDKYGFLKDINDLFIVLINLYLSVFIYG